MTGRRRAADPGLPASVPTKAYWQCPPHAMASYQSAELPSEASIVIIGSGITGASVAHHLLQQSPHLNVVMLEARTICSGATGRNGGHCKDVSFKTYCKLKTKLGTDVAKRLVKFRRSHVDVLRQLAGQLREEGLDDGHFRDVESLNAVFDQDIFRDLKQNLRAFLEDFPEERELYSIVDGTQAEEKYGLLGTCGVITSPAAALWPYRLITGVLERLINKHRNFSLEAMTPVTSITASKQVSHPYLVDTPRGVIRAQHVIHCTNGHASHLIPALRNAIVPVRGQMTAIAPSSGFPRLGDTRSWSLSWDNGGFDYMTQAGDNEGMVFLGGGVEQAASAGVVDFNMSSDSSLNEPALQHLRTILPKFFKAGEGATLRQAWTGVMGFTPHGFPVVGKIPRGLRSIEVVEGASGYEWIAAGFNGYGMVHCWQSGKAVAEMVLCQRQPLMNDDFPADLFECSSKRLEEMSFEDLEAEFHRNAPRAARSRL